MSPTAILGLLLAFVFGALVGNCAGDKQTLIDCSIKGEAYMVGGGYIKCEPKRTNPIPSQGTQK